MTFINKLRTLLKMKASSTPRKSAVTRKKEAPRRSKKGIDAIESNPTGNGWTIAAIQHFVELQTDEERIKHIQAMFNISEEEYIHEQKSSYQVDFQFSNGYFCLRKGFEIPIFQFICRTITSMWDMITSYNHLEGNTQQRVDFQQLKEEIINLFKIKIGEFTSEEYKFSAEQIDSILDHCAACLFRPIRLIYYLYHFPKKEKKIICRRKIFQPISPNPLSDYQEVIEDAPIELQFTPVIYPRLTSLSIEEVRETITNYTNDIIDKINKRYDHLESLLDNINQNIS